MTHHVGDSGHTTDHNNLETTQASHSATLASLPGTYAQLPDALLPRPESAPTGVKPVMVAQACASGHSWVAGAVEAAGSVNLNDTSQTVPFLGSQCITITTGNGGGNNQVKATGLTLDMTHRTPVVWIECDDVTKIKDIQLYLGNDGFASFWRFDIESNLASFGSGDRYLRSGKPIPLAIPWGSIAATTGTPNRAALTSVQLTVQDNSGGGAFTCRFWGFGYMPDTNSQYPNGVFVPTFDDGFASQWTVARPYMDKYNYVGTAFPIVDLVGTTGYMTLAQIKSLQDDYGWEVGAHSNTASAHNISGGFPALSDAGAAEMLANKQWLAANGLRGRDYFAYPQGLYSDATIAAVRGLFSAARTQHYAKRDTLPPMEKFRLRTRNCGSVDTLAQLKALVDEASANQEVLILTFHELVTSPSTGTQWAISDFQALIDYVASKNMANRSLGHVLRNPPL